MAGPNTALTRRASLNVVQAVLDYGAKIGVGLVVTPIMVGGLGGALFGVWEMLSRLVGQMAAADGRPTQSLRLVVANRQSSDDVAGLRRQVGSALIVWLMCLPLVLAVGGLVVWVAPTITKVPPSLHGSVRVACALLVGGLIAGTFASVPESVLRGLNLGYKRMGLQTMVSLVGGLLMAGAVYAGLGLTGLAASQILLAGLSGLCFWLLARRFVPWFGAERPRRTEVRAMLRMSLWLALGDLIAKVLLASDVLVLGAVVSATAVTTYVLTGYAARLSVNLFTLGADGVMPGLGGIIGQQAHEKAARLRSEMHTITWVAVTVVGATILMWNRSFVHLWVGLGHYAGPWVNLLLVVIAIQTAFIRSDSYVIDAALRPRIRVQVAGVTAVLVLGAAIVLTDRFGMVGLCLGILGGRTVQSIGYPILARSCLGGSGTTGMAALIRRTAVSAALLAATAWLGQRVLAPGWVEWIMGVTASGALLLCLAILAGLSTGARLTILARIRAIGGR